MTPERLELPSDGGPMPLELFRPAGKGPWPAVIVVHELWGLNDDIRRIARRFVESGYLAAAPDLYRDRGVLRCVVRVFRDLQRGEGPTVRSLSAVIRHVRDLEGVERVGIVGFCMGGGFALAMATREGLDAAGVFYGEITRGADLDRACPVVGGYGEQDPRFARQGRRLQRELERRGVPCDIAFYPGVGHSFLNDAGHPVLERLSWPVMKVGYDHEAAEDAWARMLRFFGEHLRGPPRGAAGE